LAEDSRVSLNQMHVACIALSEEAVDVFHRAGIAAGGAPGLGEGASDYYGAFTLDPNGNTIEACVHGAKHVKSGGRP